jgi:hypothetical protein
LSCDPGRPVIARLVIGRHFTFYFLRISCRVIGFFTLPPFSVYRGNFYFACGETHG